MSIESISTGSATGPDPTPSPTGAPRRPIDLAAVHCSLRLGVPHLGDLCTFHAGLGRPGPRPDAGPLRLIALLHRDPARDELLRDFAALRGGLLDGLAAAPEATLGPGGLCAGPRLQEVLLTTADREERRLLTEDLRLTSVLRVPLAWAGAPVGALCIGRAGPRSRPDDLAREEAVALGDLLSRALDRARSEHQARDAARRASDAVAIAAHEIRRPLTTLMLQLGFAEGLLSRGEAGAPARAATLLAEGKRQAGRIGELSSRMLAACRGAPVEFGREEVDLCQVVQGAIEQLGAEATHAGCALSLHASRPVVGRWDRCGVEEVVVNLLGNAIKYAPGAPIEIWVAQSGGAAQLTVSDHGPGIPPEDHEHVFERFGRCRAHQGYPGAGLGLYIVRTLLHAMGGTVTLDSQPGAGARFTVTLPTA